MATIGLRKIYSSMTSVFSDIHTVLTTAGWTVHDNISSSARVYKTNGESGIFPYIYLRLSCDSNYLYPILYLYWNASTHTGLASAYNTSPTVGTSTNWPNYCHICANKDLLTVVCEYYTSSFGRLMAGFPNKLFFNEITNLTTSATSGDAVSLEVTSSSGIRKGQYLQIVGIDSEGRDDLSVISVPDSTHIVVNNLPRNYLAGAFVGVTPCPGFLGLGSSEIRPLCPKGVSGTTSCTSAYSSGYLYSSTIMGAANPDYASNRYILFPLVFQINGTGLLGYSDENLLLGTTNSSRGTIYIVNDSGTPEQGMATSATSTTLTDSTKGWVTNAYANKMLVLVDGTGSAQSRLISSNTASTITVATAFTTTPDATTTYRIVDEVYRGGGEYTALKETCQSV